MRRGAIAATTALLACLALSSSAQATYDPVGSGQAKLSLDKGLLAFLKKDGITINPIFPAEHVGSTFTLPIIGGGSLAPGGSEGELRTGGEMEFLQLGAGQVFWREQWLEVVTRSDSSEVDVEPTPADPGKRTISASNVQLSLTAQSARTFDEAFATGKEDFKAGEAVGALSFAAQGQ